MKDNDVLKKLENKKNKNLLIFIDSDETLKRSDGTISKRTKKSILENKKIGNKIIISTARPRYQTLDVKKEVKADDIIISSNGAEIYDSKNKEVISSFFIDSTEVIKLVDYAYQMNVRLILTVDNFEYVTKDIRNKKQILLDKNNYKKELTDFKIKQCMFIDASDKINKLENIISKNKKLNIVDEISDENSYYEKWFSVASVNCSKGSSLKILANYLKVPIENTIAIGNDKNDISMFLEAGFSVAVSNATIDIKDKVDFVTLSNDEDGVAVFLEKLLYKQ